MNMIHIKTAANIKVGFVMGTYSDVRRQLLKTSRLFPKRRLNQICGVSPQIIMKKLFLF